MSEVTVLQVFGHAVGKGKSRGTSGIEVRVLESLRYIDRDKFLPVVLYSSRGQLWDRFRQTGVELVDYFVKGKLDVLSVCKLVRTMRKYQAGIIHTQGPLATDFYCALAAGLARIPHVVTRAVLISDYRISRLRKTVYSLLDRITLALAASVVVISRDGHTHMTERRKVNTDRVRIVYNGVDTNRFAPSTSPGKYRNQLCLDPSAPTFGMCAQLVPHKGYEYFVEAAATVLDELPHAEAFIIGDGPLMGTIQDLCRRLGIEARVHFTGYRQDMAELLSMLDVVVLTSLREGLPVTVLEAMATGKPVVATDVGGTRELVVNGETGFLVRPGTAEEPARKITWLLQNPDEAKEMGRRGRKLIESTFSIEKMVSSYEQVYETVAQRRG